jgi:hypothetical protein
MNNETINYAYLAGFLESELRSLPYDDKFILLKKNDFDGRVAYIKKVIENAHIKAKEFEAKYASV